LNAAIHLQGDAHADNAMAGATSIEWMERQFGIAARALLRCISATDMVCERRGFGQTIVPARGSVLAAWQVAFYDPDPDYFFHWLRDSAVIVDALRILLRDEAAHREAAVKFGDFLHFSLRLSELSGPELVRRGKLRERVEPSLRKYLRDDAELQQIEGERTLGEARCNPDGTLDILKWPRPQNDGPALRALAVLRYRRSRLGTDPGLRPLMYALATGDLAYTARHRTTRCFDIWEEELCHPYYTRLVQYAALLEGAAWARELGDGDGGTRYESAARDLGPVLDGYWSAQRRHYLSRTGTAAADPDKALDSAAMLAVLHAGLASGPHSILDPRVHATCWQLENLFRAGYAINRELPADRGPAFGRYKGDVYFDGGAWYVTTLGFAEFCFRLAEAIAGGAALRVTEDNAEFFGALGYQPPRTAGEAVPLDGPGRHRVAASLLDKGDAVMATVQRYTPAGGELSEQFDQHSGEQRSAKNLSWSYAAFVTAFAAREDACAAMAASFSQQRA
jgi:glucoamylase